MTSTPTPNLSPVDGVKAVSYNGKVLSVDIPNVGHSVQPAYNVTSFHHVKSAVLGQATTIFVQGVGEVPMQELTVTFQDGSIARVNLFDGPAVEVK